MAHLTLVANLTTSIGGSPHFSRPNFPIAPGYHPSGVVVELAGFSRGVIDGEAVERRSRQSRKPYLELIMPVGALDPAQHGDRLEPPHLGVGPSDIRIEIRMGVTDGSAEPPHPALLPRVGISRETIEKRDGRVLCPEAAIGHVAPSNRRAE